MDKERSRDFAIEDVDSYVAAKAIEGCFGGAEPTTKCVKPTFVDDWVIVIDLKVS